MGIHIDGTSCSDLDRVLAVNDSSGRRLLLQATEQVDDKWHVIAHMQLGHDYAASYNTEDGRGVFSSGDVGRIAAVNVSAAKAGSYTGPLFSSTSALYAGYIHWVQ
jgi:hypothetical protein